MGHAPKLAALKAADFTFLDANLWPGATYERLRAATLLAVWVCFCLHITLQIIAKTQPSHLSGMMVRSHSVRDDGEFHR